jgi:hypothetical protein
MNLKYLGASLVTTLLAATNAIPALARPATFNGANMYRDGSNNLYIVTTGLAPAERTLRLFDLEAGKLGRVDGCGVMSVSSTVPLTDIKINGTAYLGTTITELTGKPWVCKLIDGDWELVAAKPDAPLTPATTPTADKQIRIGNSLYLFDTNLRNQSVAITYKGNNTRSLTGGNCGLFILRSTTLSPLALTSQVQLGTAAPVLMSTLPLAPAAPQCRTTGTGGVVYVPTTWTF